MRNGLTTHSSAKPVGGTDVDNQVCTLDSKQSMSAKNPSASEQPRQYRQNVHDNKSRTINGHRLLLVGSFSVLALNDPLTWPNDQKTSVLMSLSEASISEQA